MGKIGIMGGTFDPIHNGHLLLGRQAYEEYGLDEIWYMPSGQPPHKRDHNVTSGEYRLSMTYLAVAGQTGFICSDYELKKSGNTYTSDTLRSLGEEFPQHTFYFIIGADSLYEIENWHEPAMVMAQTTLLVAPRKYDSAEISMDAQISRLKTLYHAKIFLLHCQIMDIASADLRKAAAQGVSIKPYVPNGVWEFIQNHHLYQSI